MKKPQPLIIKGLGRKRKRVMKDKDKNNNKKKKKKEKMKNIIIHASINELQHTIDNRHNSHEVTIIAGVLVKTAKARNLYGGNNKYVNTINLKVKGKTANSRNSQQPTAPEGGKGSPK